MNRFLVRLTAVVGLVAVVAAAPIRKAPESTDISNGFLAKREFSCAKTVEGLTASDCKYMSKMGMKGQGVNARKNPGSGIWVGEDGHNTFVFENESKGKVTVIIWNKGTLPDGKPDYEGHCMNVRVPQVSWSLAKGEKVTVSLSKEKVSGGFAAIYEGSTKINGFGQIDQTWGEFTTGDYATVDVSRLIRMDGEPMSMRTSVGCVSNMEKCVFVCKQGNICGKPDTYNLQNCVNPGETDPRVKNQPNTTPQQGANHGWFNNQPEGGCQGWSKTKGGKGRVVITLSSK
ncbi:hypothetical protein GGTG_03377 [Gaeumannomyces tritici R3-111a-1]|uniref:Effector 5 n=1 Tax=Gaeumannomyces tritici (strain R3-111a-1) TaxID=644352 RepID=J3NQ19_GAET3|nr:hypothetical protein GGTG_03377 [Gaeumannomyces tritici R3-111a-1]EJT78275.1 hypothetical protein GGTG_03377 [Gaeumannomyces tritici R3-111a-1]